MGRQRSCGPSTAGFSTLVGHNNILNQVAVFGAVPDGATATVSLDGGGLFAARVFEGPRGSGVDYYVWFSYPAKASGRVQAEGPAGVIGTHSFEAERRGTKLKTGTGVVATNELFGNDYGPGEKIGLDSDWWRGGYYTFLLRRYLDKTCLHFEGSSRCAITEDLGDGFQLVLVARQRAERFFGGLVGDDVETIEFRIGGEAYHVPVSPGRLVAMGSDGEIVDSMWVGRRP